MRTLIAAGLVPGLLLAALLLAGLEPALAAGPPARCTVSVGSVRFGTYLSSTGADLVSAGNVTYLCTASVPILVALDRGGAASFAERRMTQGPYALLYNLYLDPAGTVIWGDGTGGSRVYSDPAPPANAPVQVTVHARIPARQSGVRVGVYANTVNVTILF